MGIQFPLKVAYAITAHKIQGQTIPKPHKIALDIASVFEDAQAHVMLSRVEEFEQIFVLDKLPERNIRASPKALKELKEMNERSINQNPTPWKQKNENFLKIASLNCMNLNNTYKDKVSDATLSLYVLFKFIQFSDAIFKKFSFFCFHGVGFWFIDLSFISFNSFNAFGDARIFL